jgi:hypothetical protein
MGRSAHITHPARSMAGFGEGDIPAQAVPGNQRPCLLPHTRLEAGWNQKPDFHETDLLEGAARLSQPSQDGRAREMATELDQEPLSSGHPIPIHQRWTTCRCERSQLIRTFSP